MNQSLLLHVVERLESLIGRLPATIQKPILSELTPLKELFLQQRLPRLAFVGSDTAPIAEILDLIFPNAIPPQPATARIYHWTDLTLPERGAVSLLDGRGGDEETADQVMQELERQPADVLFFVDDCHGSRGPRKIDIGNLRKCANLAPAAKIIGIAYANQDRKNALERCAERLRTAVKSDDAVFGNRFIDAFDFSSGGGNAAETKRLASTLARELPNEARIEMTRILQDKEAQHQVAQILIKSTTAICTAIGTQPIPLADMPILTTLQLVMVSGIMYVSGRERSLRAATEFIGALGVNVGAGLLLREGARAILKFFPGWGNVVSGMVAGAGTYAMGRAATAFFLEGVSLKEARRTYLTSRKRSPDARLAAPKPSKGRRSASK